MLGSGRLRLELGRLRLELGRLRLELGRQQRRTDSKAMKQLPLALPLSLLGLLPLCASAQATVAGSFDRPSKLSLPPKPMRLVMLGDYGEDGIPEADVAALVDSLDPDLIVTAGDNNYHEGKFTTIDANIGKHYQQYIAPYLGFYGPGAERNRFFPVPGNHDWRTPGLIPYLTYFTLPGNERYYDFVLGPVHFFMLDSDVLEPDGVTVGSVQAQVFQSLMSSSTADYKVVLLHHAPYSSAKHGPALDLQWPFAAWGADVVLAGHDHVYERLSVDGITYVVNGLGGRKSIYSFQSPIAGSRVRFNLDYGAVVADIDHESASFSFLSRTGIVLDRFPVLANDPLAPAEFLIPGGSDWKYLDDGTDPGTTWTLPGFDDSPWPEGPAQLGYGDGDEATLVSFGPNAASKYVTTYFRRSFPVTDAASLTSLRLDLMRDDGAVVYLNGVEVHRVNLPAGPITSGMLATGTVASAAEDSLYETVLDPALLLSGMNLIAVEIHQAAPTSSDISFDLKLSGFRNTSVLVPKGSDWSFLDTGLDPGAAWVEPGFDDSGWLAGPAPLGYGDGDEATVVGFGPDALNKFATTYFRHSFTVANPSAWNGLFLRLQRDAGAVVYLNGAEVHRDNLPLTAVTASSLAGYTQSGADESFYIETRLYPAKLVAGTNVLAVEIHRADASGPDLSFGLELVGRP